MIKQLLSAAAVAALSFGFTANADTLDILGDLGSCGWGNTYDKETHTATFEGSWKGIGWWVDGDKYAAYDQVIVEFEPVDFTVQVVVEYAKDLGVTNTTAQAQAGDSSVKAVFEPEYKDQITQIYVQNAAEGSITFTGAYLENGVEIDPNVLWEGEVTISGWNKAAEFPASKVKAGDVVCYTFTEPGTGSQVLVKGSDWNNLLGTAKISDADMAKGEVYLGVTQDMLDACGGSIFIQGDGGCVVTKVSKTDKTFDPAGVVAYGERTLGSSIYAVLPTDATALVVEFSAQPEWSQLCNSSWIDLELESADNEDGTIRTYTLTAEAIEAFNAKKEFIINGAGAELVSVKVMTPSGVENIEAVVDENAPVEYFNLQGVRVANPAEGGIYIRRQGNKVSKILVK